MPKFYLVKCEISSFAYFLCRDQLKRIFFFISLFCFTSTNPGARCSEIFLTQTHAVLVWVVSQFRALPMHNILQVSYIHRYFKIPS